MQFIEPLESSSPWLIHSLENNQKRKEKKGAIEFQKAFV